MWELGFKGQSCCCLDREPNKAKSKNPVFMLYYILPMLAL